MSHRYERRRRGNGCLAWLVAIVWILLIGVLAYRFFLRPQISQLIGQRLVTQPGTPRQTPGAGNQQIEQAAGQALPTVIASVPSGSLTISEAQANNYLSSRAGALGPIESATIRFVPNELQVDISALGTTSTARMGLGVQNGRIIVIDPRIDGILGQFITLDDLASSFERQINDELAAQGRRVTDVQINQGELLVTVEG